jgi:hypothetical protein
VGTCNGYGCFFGKGKKYFICTIDYTPLPSMLLDALLSKLQQETQLGKLLVVLFVISVIMTSYFDVLFPVPVIGLIQWLFFRKG